MTVDDLEEAFDQAYRNCVVPKEDAPDDDNELSAGATDVCTHCKKTGHLIARCWRKLKEEEEKKEQANAAGYGGDKFTGKCNHCNRIGHKEVDCWSKEENKDKRPAWFVKLMAKKSESEQGNAGVGDDDIEFLMCGVCVDGEDAGSAGVEAGERTTTLFNRKTSTAMESGDKSEAGESFPIDLVTTDSQSHDKTNPLAAKSAECRGQGPTRKRQRMRKGRPMKTAIRRPFSAAPGPSGG